LSGCHRSAAEHWQLKELITLIVSYYVLDSASFILIVIIRSFISCIITVWR